MSTTEAPLSLRNEPTSSPLGLAGASAAIALPALLAFNYAPSATFFNQAAAIIGWAAFLMPLARSAGSVRMRPRDGLSALLAALAICALAVLGAWWFDGLPRALALSPLGIIGAAALTALMGAAAKQAGLGAAFFRACCVALILAGLFSVLVGVIQVFAPDWVDGLWIASSAFEGRASGNLRQPNHLSSLLLWSIIAAVWLAQTKTLGHRLAAGLVALFVFGVVLSASRTGIVGVVMLALWGLLDRRLSRPLRVMLMLSPVAYAVFWLGLAVWAHESRHVFGGEARISADGDISSSRFAIWSDTLALIAQHPWLGVGFGEFNFAWSLTPFPHRPVAFFDHTHNFVLQLAVELGLPVATLVLCLLAYALWRAFVNARDDEGPQAPMLRAAFMMVLMMAVHSQLEYPLWYAYFLLPTAFAFGLCVGADGAGRSGAPVAQRLALVARALLLACVLMFATGVAVVLDYLRVVAIFVSDDTAPPLAQRVADGQRSWFFAHHAEYAAATTTDHPADAMPSFKVATHYLLDTRLMMAWAHALYEAGDAERARHIAQRLREFHNEDSKPFFAPCDEALPAGAERPFQCTPPTRKFDYRDFR